MPLLHHYRSITNDNNTCPDLGARQNKTFLGKVIAQVATCLLVLSGIAGPVNAQDVVFPQLEERTGDFLDGLSSDSTAKIVELGDFDNDGLEDLVISRTGDDPVCC